MTPIQHLPKELRRLVRKTTTLLGEVLREQNGPRFFNKAEGYRRTLKSLRQKNNKTILDQLTKKLSKEDPADQLKIAHAFSLLLELTNCCESAYRTWRQQQKSVYSQGSPSSPLDLTFVLTAHPTEARAPLVIEFCNKITSLLNEGLQNNFVFNDEKLRSYLRALLTIPLVKQKAPSVYDEADYIFSILFYPPVLDFILVQNDPYRIRLRTWVGGDKDGHPGVNAEVMLGCLERSRKKLISHLSFKIGKAVEDLKKMDHHRGGFKSQINKLEHLATGLQRLSSLKKGDGKRVAKWRKDFQDFCETTDRYIQHHYELQLVLKSFTLFPAFVFPIELREDSEQIQEALKSRSAAISRMLFELGRVSEGLNITDYARGLVISNCESSQDIVNARQLISNQKIKTAFPTIPLFESGDSLLKSKDILKEWLDLPGQIQYVRRELNSRVEVMLGYSDSAKQIGVLSSRHLIRSAMEDISSFLKSRKLTPVFFHGSGGSVARGGGSLREQISWWSEAATQAPKLTVQGEMIQRNFSTKEILHAQCLHFVTAFGNTVKPKAKSMPKAFILFADSSRKNYEAFVKNERLLAQSLEATPYRYLDILKIGSRPSKRPAQQVSLNHLRAIPWVLCWTQTRILLPTWWGVGQSWKDLSEEHKNQLKDLFKTDAFFSSFVKQLGFTLAKVDLLIWQKYLDAFSSNKSIYGLFESEFNNAKNFCHDVSGESSLVWHRPWLQESIQFRSPNIHLLNLLQIIAMKREDENLLKETLVGIACGMLTTG